MNTRALLAFAFSASLSMGCAAETGDDADPALDDEDVDSTSEALTSPASFNPPSMHHNKICAKLAVDEVQLRYADGSPNGFTLKKSGLVFDEDAKECASQADKLGDAAAAKLIRANKPSGYIMLDVHELASGDDLAFHRGGFGYVNGAVKYGFVYLSNLVGRDQARVKRAKNALEKGFGKECSTIVKTYTVQVKTIQGEMQYRKSNDPVDTNSWQSYGDPSSQYVKPPTRKYTYVNWTWPANPGGEPNAGGGMVRTIIPDGATFERCNVKAIRGPSFIENTRTPNGEVVAIYGRYKLNGDTFYGWITYSHTFNGKKELHVR